MKKTRNRIFIFLVIVAILLLAALYFNWFNLGSAFGFPFMADGAKISVENKTAENSLEISISQDTILLANKEVSLEELTAELKKYDFSKTSLYLIDKGATLGTYEQVEAMLKNENYPYFKKDILK